MSAQSGAVLNSWEGNDLMTEYSTGEGMMAENIILTGHFSRQKREGFVVVTH